MTTDGRILLEENEDVAAAIADADDAGYNVIFPPEVCKHDLTQMPDEAALDVIDPETGTPAGSIGVEFSYTIQKGTMGRYIDCTVDEVVRFFDT